MFNFIHLTSRDFSYVEPCNLNSNLTFSPQNLLLRCLWARQRKAVVILIKTDWCGSQSEVLPCCVIRNETSDMQGSTIIPSTGVRQLWVSYLMWEFKLLKLCMQHRLDCHRGFLTLLQRTKNMNKCFGYFRLSDTRADFSRVPWL